ncbi:MAG TPA: heat-inducible transcription repressor HrcA [Clostridiaceae bacterium]|nr:heat-inducible transcription repressor HrcA [Clostridiaceae bacterium]
MLLDERKRKILHAVVSDYISSAEPVGSRTIAKKHELGLSSATIRNEMSDLEEMGYLEQPHTSAGRIPSDKGYRLYVDELMSIRGLTFEEIETIRLAMETKINELNQLLRQATDVMSRLTKYTSMAITPHMKKSIIKSVRVIPIDNGKALIILVTSGGTVKNSIIKVSDYATMDYLNKVSNALEQKLVGLAVGDVNEMILSDLSNIVIDSRLMMKTIIDGLSDCIEGIDNREVYLEGTSNIFNFPEFRDIAKAKEFLSVLDRISLLKKLLNSNNNQTDKINIKIGSENEIEEIKDCSLIKATYSIGDMIIGSIGVIGPTRMDYAKVISSMMYIRKKINQEILKLFRDDE